jgi:uncharacterized protein (TIGR02246 family)
MSKDERTIRELVTTWMAATKAGDLPKILSLMAEDVIFMVPGKEPFGKEAFAANAKELRNVRVDGKAEIRELRVLGDWAFLRNHLTVTMTPEAGQSKERTGYTLTILRKEPDGRWVLFRDANLLSG